MPQPHILAPEAEAQLGALGSADVVVAVTADGGEDPEPQFAAMHAGLRRQFEGINPVLLYIHAAGKPLPAASANGLPVLDLPIAVGDSGPRAMAPRLALEAGKRLRARGAAVVSTELSSLGDGWIDRLLGPVLRQESDLVVAQYHRHPFSGVVTSGILYPLIRALYGRRVRYPLGTDFACSARLGEKQLGSEGPRGRQTAFGLELRLLSGAVAGGLAIRQARLGPRVGGSGDSLSPSAILSAAVSPVFAEMERTAPIWQKIRGSVPVEAVGDEETSGLEPVAVDGRRLLEAFRLGQQNLAEVWGLILPPGILVELKRVARLPDPEFRIPDPVWARIVYDFSIAHRTRIISRDHLMGALAPLYLGWFGSFYSEMGESDPGRLEERLERLCLQFETEKPYLISRWRWPDRFNP